MAALATYLFAFAFLVAVLYCLATALLTARALRVERENAEAASQMLAADRAQGRERRQAERKAKRRATSSQAKLDRAGLDMGSGTWGALRFGGAALAGAFAQAALGNAVLSLAVGAVAFAAAGSWRARKGDARQEEMSAQLAAALPQVAANIRCGMTAERALRAAAEVAAEPMHSAFERMNAQMAYGVSLADGLADMAARTGNDDVRLVSVAVAMQQEAGGELSDVLDRIAGKVQSRMSLRRQVATGTASVRTSRNMLAAMPWLIAALLAAITPETMAFWRGDAGALCAAAVLGVEIVAVLLMGKIMKVDLG